MGKTITKSKADDGLVLNNNMLVGSKNDTSSLTYNISIDTYKHNSKQEKEIEELIDMHNLKKAMSYLYKYEEKPKETEYSFDIDSAEEDSGLITDIGYLYDAMYNRLKFLNNKMMSDREIAFMISKIKHSNNYFQNKNVVSEIIKSNVKEIVKGIIEDFTDKYEETYYNT